ncbi:hypothetical protein TNCV_1156711 [Trichonephila clavipes]|nr:hypothetical protein TNCV_1156711 [Trichonephila clavipes]
MLYSSATKKVRVHQLCPVARAIGEGFRNFEPRSSDGEIPDLAPPIQTNNTKPTRGLETSTDLTYNVSSAWGAFSGTRVRIHGTLTTILCLKPLGYHGHSSAFKDFSKYVTSCLRYLPFENCFPPKYFFSFKNKGKFLGSKLGL